MGLEMEDQVGRKRGGRVGGNKRRERKPKIKGHLRGNIET